MCEEERNSGDRPGAPIPYRKDQPEEAPQVYGTVWQKTVTLIQPVIEKCGAPHVPEVQIGEPLAKCGPGFFRTAATHVRRERMQLAVQCVQIPLKQDQVHPHTCEKHPHRYSAVRPARAHQADSTPHGDHGDVFDAQPDQSTHESTGKSVQPERPSFGPPQYECPDHPRGCDHLRVQMRRIAYIRYGHTEQPGGQQRSLRCGSEQPGQPVESDEGQDGPDDHPGTHDRFKPLRSGTCQDIPWDRESTDARHVDRIPGPRRPSGPGVCLQTHRPQE